MTSKIVRYFCRVMKITLNIVNLVGNGIYCTVLFIGKMSTVVTRIQTSPKMVK